MAVIIQEASRALGGSVRRSITPVGLILALSAMIFVVAVLAGAPLVGSLFAGTFAVGSALASLEHRPLSIASATTLGGLHLLALLAVIA